MSGRLFLLLFFVLQMAGTAVALWLLAAADRRRLDEGDQAKTVRSWNGNNNPSATDWMLTVSAEQNGREITEADLVDAFEDWSWMGQREEGGHTGYRHYQLFMQATSRIRLSTVRARLEKRHGIHVNYIEPRRYSVASCVAYVSKKETRQAGPFLHGDFDMHEDQGKRTDLEELRDAVVKGASVNEILNDPELSLKAARFMPWLEKMVGAQQAARFSQEDREVTVHYLWGRPGLGKTRSVLDGDRSQIFRVTNYEHPFDDYSGQSTLVLDEFAGQLPFQLLLNVLDRYPCKLPCRFHDTWAGWTTVWIISNKPLERQYQDVEPQVRAALDRRITTNEEFKSNEEFVAIVARAEAEVNEDLAFLETLSAQPDWDEEPDGEDCL